MPTDKSKPQPVKCGEVTWKGTDCTRRAVFVLQTYKGEDATPVCNQHLYSVGPGVRYRKIDTTA